MVQTGLAKHPLVSKNANYRKWTLAFWLTFWEFSALKCACLLVELCGLLVESTQWTLNTKCNFIFVHIIQMQMTISPLPILIILNCAPHSTFSFCFKTNSHYFHCFHFVVVSHSSDVYTFNNFSSFILHVFIV